MAISQSSHIPVELMEILTRINDNVNEVKERLARLEGQDHADSIKSLRDQIDKERNERIRIQTELSNIKAKLAPILVGVSMLGAAVVEFFFRNLHG